ncbi:DUF1036 domain-containing protein [Reyranella sp. CPCC 100927]|uniref:DUF1036 domain-containing protein n=1 Tax=Reyranella sp. CPCC 100927 TaxID=2599616 RepID=UPI0011B51073|nr:DUF1036 domain-containing protein [Reyranella sp. CPCC 100927]TWS95127.1 DUF1036 domain-containing protein [Reyranella sp. CPCC 100927]
MRWGVWAAIAGLMVLPGTTWAQSGVTAIRVCNQTSKQISVAKASATGQTENGKPIFMSQGWYTVAPKDCAVLWSGPFSTRYYYVYAESANSHWSGNYPMCVSDKAFRIADNQCGQGYRRRMFNEIDISGRSGVFTYTFQGS